jgi:lysozyme family protein
VKTQVFKKRIILSIITFGIISLNINSDFIIDLNRDIILKDSHWFDQTIQFVLKYEGDAFVYNREIGEISKYGITLDTYKEYYGSGDVNSIRNITSEQAIEIYKYKFWYKHNLDMLVFAGYGKTASVMLDSGINIGPYRVNKFIQYIVGVPQTGIIDANTVLAIYNSGHTDEELCKLLLNKRKHHYDLIISRNDDYSRFRNGWNNRIRDITQFIMEINV